MKYQGITITKNKKCNTWYARFRKNGKQFYISAKTQQLCYDKLKNALKQKSKEEIKTNKSNNNKSMTFIEWYNKWLELYKINQVKESTIKDYSSSIKYMEKLNNIPINTITSIQILEQLNKIPFPRKKQKVHELLNDIFNKARINKITENNPIEIIRKPKHKKVNGIAFTSKDEQKLIQLLNDNNLDMFLVCLYQGLRRGEMLALTMNDIDFDNKTLTINKSLNRENKSDTTKNEYSNRIMPLFDNTINILNKYKNKKGRIFDVIYSKSEKIYNNLIKENFKQKYTIHSLRHTFITRCQEKQIPLHITQKWVGHNIGSCVTTQVYTHSRDIAEAENIIKMNT